MNDKKIRTLEQLRDSEILYHKQIPSFGYWIIITILSLLIFIFIWSRTGIKTDIIKATGVVQSVNKNYVMAPYSGEILEMNIEEGKYVEKEDVLFVIKSTDVDLQLTQLDEQKQLYGYQISQYEKLVQSVKEDENYFDAANPDDSLYYSQFELYKSQIEQQSIDAESYRQFGYSEEQIEAELIKSQAKVVEIYHSTIQSAEASKLQLQTQLTAIESQELALQQGKSDYNVLATITGKIHMVNEFKVGMFIQAGSSVASIANAQDEFKIVANVNAQDITRIELGNSVDVVVYGLPQSLYGTIPGKITKIDSDITVPATSSENPVQAYFKIEITPDYTYLIAKSGGSVNLANGLVVESRIQHNQMTYFEYFIETLGIK
ncbi:HlyD family secretion protein [Ruminococcaceae bacterium OttesenSCG-928-A16]|nr:HlyD family secretion protein [Ruminococcaceae bacterium OttesenSCG-928-A16]